MGRPVADAPPRGTQSLQRALSLVRIVAGEGPRGLRIQELTRLSGLAETTVFRMVQGLLREGVLERDVHTRKLYLGRLMSELGLAARRTPLHALCGDAIETLARRTRSVVYLSDRSGNEAVCVGRAIGESPEPMWALGVGLRSPLGLGVGGLAILSALPDATVDAVVAANAERCRVQHGLTPRALLANVREARRLGHARRRSLMVPGAIAIGIPFRYRDGVASMTVSSIGHGGLGSRHAREVVAHLREAKAIVEAAAI
jgi:DNA-binding IclR family transcriptional regulator